MKFGISQYWVPTPKKIKKVADSILAAVLFAGPTAALNGYPMAGTVIFITGVVAKFVSNLFGEEPTTT